MASGDQRLLVFTVASESSQASVQKTLQAVANDQNVIGKYHFDIAGESDTEWSDVITGGNRKQGIFIIQSGEFGQDGKIIAELDINSDQQKLLVALNAANKQFVASEKRKDYAAHIDKGRAQGVKFENNLPFGEDRDGDGVIDLRPSRRR